MTAAADPATERVRQVVLATITEIVPDLAAAQIADDRTLQELGADSIDRLEILGLLAERLAAAEPVADLAGIGTVGELVRHLAEDGVR